MNALNIPRLNKLGLFALMLIVGSCLGVCGTAAAEAADGDIVSSAQDREDIALTVYNSDLALIRESRRMTLPAGAFNIEFQDVPTAINTRSLLIDVAKGGSIDLIEQNYQYDLMSKQKILEKYVGRQLSWIKEDGSRVTGTLLGMADGPIYEVDGEIVFQVPGRIALPELPENLRSKPTLIWRAEADRAGDRVLDVSYLSGGLSWSADYVLDINTAGTEGGLQAWVTVNNHSGAGYENAELMLLAGDIHQARQPAPEMMADVMYAAKAGREMPTVEKVHDYHLYTIPQRTTLKNREVKQLSLFSVDGIQLEKRYVLNARPAYFHKSGPGAVKQKVAIFYRLENSKKNNLYRALPSGTFRIYGVSSSGARQLLGSDMIDHTPRGETLDLQVGNAFDLVAERTHVNHTRRGDHVFQNTYEIVLKNHGDQPVNIEVVEYAGATWEVLDASHPAKRLDASNLQFNVPVPAEGETVLTYRIQITR
jgi:hypothetical protein